MLKNSSPDQSMPTDRSFGLTFAAISAFVAIYDLLNKTKLEWSIFLLLSAILIFLSLFVSKFLNKANKIWFLIGNLMAKISNPIIYALIFFLIFSPLGLFFKISKRDLLRLEFEDLDSNWEASAKIENYAENFNDQF